MNGDWKASQARFRKWLQDTFKPSLETRVLGALREGRGYVISAAVIARILNADQRDVLEALERLDQHHQVRRIGLTHEGISTWTDLRDEWDRAS